MAVGHPSLQLGGLFTSLSWKRMKRGKVRWRVKSS
jgi:hypothetical protein